MTIGKNGNGWRIRYMENGKQKSIQLDHEPSKREARQLIADRQRAQETYCDNPHAFSVLAMQYIESKKNILSPNTRRGYMTCYKRLSEDFARLSINDIDQLTIQMEINRLAATLSPKTCTNTHGFISAVMEMYRPSFQYKIQLPQAVKTDFYCPTEEDVKSILDYAKDTRYYVAFCLGTMGMRRGEICALEYPADLNGNIVTINKAIYTDENFKRGIKQPKTTDSTRQVYIPDELVERIHQDRAFYAGEESSLIHALTRYQRKLGIKHFRFHDLRVYFGTYAHIYGLPDKAIQDTAGWKTDYTMKKIYRKSQQQINIDSQKEYWKKLKI